MQTVTFYTRLGCENCNKAYQMLLDVAYDMPLEIDMVDITHAHNQELKRIYGGRIPVLSKQNSDTELDWPFKKTDIEGYLAK